MRTLTTALLTAAALAIAIPAYAQGVSVGIGPNGVGVREHRDHDWRRDRGEVRIREHARHCRVTIIHRDGMTKRIKRCD